ncbi:hypothetical protein EGW08_006192, partial [Elysia chlorotica]
KSSIELFLWHRLCLNSFNQGYRIIIKCRNLKLDEFKAMIYRTSFLNLVPFYCFLFVFDHEGVTVKGTAVCLYGWTPSGNSPTCMQAYVSEKKTWTDAQASCRKRDGDLVTHTDGPKLKAIKNMLGDDQFNVWIGLSDTDTEDVFLWSDTGEQFTPPNWDINEPDNFDENQHCVIAKYNDAKEVVFADEACETSYGYICEIKEECRPGKHGEQCDQNCNVQCKGGSNPCEKRTARCTLGCDNGYLGSTCGTQCPAKKYGRGCMATCSLKCAGAGDCNHVNGRCTEGCKDGYAGDTCEDCAPGKYGKLCTEKCPVNCKGQDNPCDRDTGHCSQGCDAGYVGELCDNKCPKKKYGAGCMGTCSPYCKGQGDCNHVSGKCTNGCEDGYRGDKCDMVCRNKTYGAGCVKSCSPHCGGPWADCNNVNGMCTEECQDGYLGDYCDKKCDVGYFGANCSEICSEFCRGSDNACSNVNGTCTNGCENQRTGDFCEDNLEESDIINFKIAIFYFYIPSLLLITIGFAFIIYIGLFLGVFGSKKAHEDMEANASNMTENVSTAEHDGAQKQ